MNWLNFISDVPVDVQRKLATLLPDYLQTIVISASETHNGLSSIFRLPLYSKEKALEWMKNFEEKSLTTYNVTKTFEENTQKVLFKKCFHCHHNTRATAKVKAHKKHTGCNAKLSITVKQPYMKRSKDEYLKEYPTEVDLSFTHNHSIDSAESLRYRHPTQELENTILNYFENGHSPSSALESYKTDLYINYGSEYFKIIADGSKCPTRKWCYDLFYKVFKKHYSEPSGDEMIVALEKAVEEYNDAENQTCAAVRGSDDSVIVAICTPLMKRVYGLESSEEIMFVDSSNNMGKNNRRTVLMFLCPSVAGALPLGIVVTFSNNECIITEGIALLVEISGFKNFSPKIIMTGDCAAERNSVQRAFPLSNLLLCRFRVLQSVWRYLFDRTNKVEESDRQHLYRLFHKTLNEETKEGFERNFEEMLSSSATKKYRNYVQYLTDFHKRSSEWAMYARTELVRDNRTYIFSEATMRVLKDRILKCTKSFSVIQLFDFLIKNFSSYYERLIIDMINNRTEDMMKSKYFVADDEIQNLDCHQINESYYAVMSGDDTYFVDFALETCTCPVGREGISCKHQYVVVKKFNLISESFVPLTDNAAKKSLYFIATGIPNVSDSVFDVLPLKQEDETLDDLEATFESLKDKLIRDSDTFQEPIKAFVDNFKKLNTDSGLISALHNFGNVSGTKMLPTSKGKSLQRGREVLAQPAVPQRILPRVGCKETPLHSKPVETSEQDHCNNKRTMLPIMSESPVKKQKCNTADSVEQSVMDKDVMHSRLDEFANICYEQKSQKSLVTQEQSTAVPEKNQESLPSSQGKKLAKCPRPVGSAQPAECPRAASQKTRQATYEILQEESDVTLQQYEKERRAVDPEKVQQVLSECEQAWRDCDGPGAEPVTTATQLAAECGREPPGSISIGAMHLQDVDGGRKKASHELLSRLDGAIEAMVVGGGGTPSKSDDSMAQHLHDLPQTNSSGQKDNPSVSETDECVSRFLLNINAPIRDLETSGTEENHVSKIIERESANYSHKSISGFVQEQRQVANGASSVHRGGSMGSTEYSLGVVTKDMIPEGVDSGLWNLMDSVGNPTLEGNNVTCANSKTSDTAGSQVERVSSGQSIAHIPSIMAERNYSFGSSVTQPDCRGMRYSDADFCRPVSQSLWEAADAAAGVCGHVVAADQSYVSKRGIVRESTCQNLWWTADGFKADKWSKANMINKEGQALRSGPLLVSGSASLDETVLSVSGQMGCKELSAFSKFSRYMRPKMRGCVYDSTVSQHDGPR